MKKRIILGLCGVLCGTAFADVFYLHADMGAGSTPLDKSIWWSDPVGGVTQESLDAPTTGNRFDVNGYAFRTPSATGTSTFPGTVVVGSAGAGTAELLAAGWDVAGLDFNNAILMRLRKSSVALSVTDMVLDPSANLSFRTHTDGSDSLNLSIANLTGSGILSFGEFSSCTSGVWSVSITDNTFSGSMDLQYGELTFGNAFDLSDASLAIDSSKENYVVLDHAVSFSNVVFGASVLEEGTYTAAELNTEFGTDIFSGTETLTVAPEPATLGMLGIGGLMALVVRRVSQA
jgi:hypothetical protein